MTGNDCTKKLRLWIPCHRVEEPVNIVAEINLQKLFKCIGYYNTVSVHWVGRIVNSTCSWPLLTQWGRVMHICVSDLTIIGSDDGLSPSRRQAIIWTNAGILSIGPLGANFSEILIEIHTFSLKKMDLKTLSAKCRPFRLDLNLLSSGVRLNMNMPSYHYRNSHYKDNTVSRPSYLYNGNPHTKKDRPYIETGPRSRMYT